eukprot:TRINITY_DN2737_c0_g1_i2.p1 TRINITY_DN2737_c0_g1~~TRINITY_DN2737_c0_g1_i2.p1  ORF type:complete len:437 (-),score=100.28 TRINITY_DN2737_c0_g1_i2:69-1379(-)
MTEDDIQDFKDEVSIMVHLRHPNILLLLGACYDPGELMIVTELMEMDLGELIHGDREISLGTKIKISKDIANGLTWLHLSNPPIIHRDIKPNNILIDENMRAKLCDFGLSCIQRKRSFRDDGEAPGSPLWMSPEVLLGENIDETSDIYAYSIVIWELMTEEDPFSHYDDLDPFMNAVCYEGERPPLPDNMNPTLKDLLTKCWSEDVNVRPPASTISAILDDILVESCIEDVEAREFWRSNFETSTVPFGDFAKKFYEMVHQDYPVYPEYDEGHKCLAAVFPEYVSVEQFGNFLVWFGPLDDTILHRLVELLEQPWFFGDITRDEAEAKLSDFDKKGTFLIRLSTNNPRDNPYTLSLIRKQIMHLRIKRVSAGLRILFKKQSKTIKVVEPNLLELVKTIKGPLSLGKPCLGRKYKDIFKKKGGVYLVTNYDSDSDEF